MHGAHQKPQNFSNFYVTAQDSTETREPIMKWPRGQTDPPAIVVGARAQLIADRELHSNAWL